MTRWTVEATGDDKLGLGRTYSVVKVTDGKRDIVRARWVGLSCIDAQVIAAELQRAYDEGIASMSAWRDAAELAAERLAVFDTSLGDDNG